MAMAARCYSDTSPPFDNALHRSDWLMLAGGILLSLVVFLI
jgi:energy-coupling factor transporter transmembrane protein EcfT